MSIDILDTCPHSPTIPRYSPYYLALFRANVSTNSIDTLALDVFIPLVFLDIPLLFSTVEG